MPQAAWERHVPPLRAMEETLHGTIWNTISPLLTTDDAVRCRTVTRRWNVGSRFGEMDEMFFQFLHNDPFAKHKYYDSEGNKTYTMLMKRNPIMGGFRKWGLHVSKVAGLPSEVCSLGEAVLSLVVRKRSGTFSTQGVTPEMLTTSIRCRVVP